MAQTNTTLQQLEKPTPGTGAAADVSLINRNMDKIDKIGTVFCTSGTRPASGLFNGLRIYETDTKATGIWDGTQWLFWDSVTQTYTPTWTANGGGAPSVGNGSLTGRYRVSGKLLWFKIVLAFGSTTSGGSTEWFFTLPPGFTASSNGEQLVPAKGYSVGYSDWSGYALIVAGETRLRPYLPRSISNAGSGWVRNCDATNATGTGVPQVPGNFSFINGASLTVEGTIEVA